MLKLTYTESGLHLELLARSIEEFVASRAILALRTGQSIHIEPSHAAFLLPSDLPELEILAAAIRWELPGTISLGRVDSDYAEVSFRGIWIASNPCAEEGTFAAVMSDRTEFHLHQLWQLTQTELSFLT